MIELKVQQRSLEWFEARLGKVTGTRLKNVFKSDNLSLIDELIAETVSQEIEESYVNEAMQRGIDYEPIAMAEFQRRFYTEIEDVGFCISEEHDILGLSPDGFSKDRKTAVEIKCPSTKAHVKFIRQNKLPNEYKYQVYCYFIVNPKLEVLHFVSYDDRFNVKPFHSIEITRESITDELKATTEGLIKFQEKYLKIYKEVIG